MTNQTLMLTETKLDVTWPDGRVEDIVLGQKITQIGIDPSLTGFVIPQKYNSIQPIHCEIHPEGFQYRIVDLNSSGLVILNGVPIDDEILKHEDLIEIGNVDLGQRITLRFIFPAGALIQQKNSPEYDQGLVLSNGVSSPPKTGNYFKIWAANQANSYVPIKNDIILIGRSEKADIHFPESFPYISVHHAEVRKVRGGYQVVDLGSTNGTMVNGWIIDRDENMDLNHGDIIRLGDDKLGVSIGLKFVSVEVEKSTTEVIGTQAFPSLETVLSKQKVIKIGRNDEADIALTNPRVSREHAQFEEINGKYYVRDLGSRNGTFLNGERITYAEVQESDQIEIGAHTIFLMNGELHQLDNMGFRLDVVDLIKDVKTSNGKLRILDDIDMTVLPRDFIAIVGGSGAGKTTLMNALLGVTHAEGSVLINGHNYYEEIEKFRDQIGYVPQSDILHTALSVENALHYAAELRLPSDTTTKERDERIANALETVSMNTDVIRQTRINRLSGGQRKRISIAAELLADPKLLFLDEPTSGLDPGLEKKMMHTLRRMADQGRTVVLITHATANIVQVDHVAFLSEGQLVYFGPPNEALTFFEVKEFADIYDTIANRGKHWRAILLGKKKIFYDKYIEKRQETRRFLPIPKLTRLAGANIKRFFSQLSLLTRRSFNIQSSDFITLALLAALYPFTAILQLLIASKTVLIGDLAIMADPIAAAKIIVETYAPLLDTRLFVFITGLEAVLIGMYVPSNELILERNIYRRERMVNLRLTPYLFSKIFVFSIFAFVQCALYLLVLSIGVDYPSSGIFFPAVIEIFITIFITMVSSISIGLFVSSLARSPAMSMYILVILLFFQFFFAGVIFDLRGKPVEMLQTFTSTHWSMVALGSTVDLPSFAESTIVCTTLPDNPITPVANDEGINCQPYPEAVDDLQLSYGREELLEAWGYLIGIGMLFTAFTWFSIKRLD